MGGVDKKNVCMGELLVEYIPRCLRIDKFDNAVYNNNCARRVSRSKEMVSWIR